MSSVKLHRNVGTSHNDREKLRDVLRNVHEAMHTACRDEKRPLNGYRIRPENHRNGEVRPDRAEPRLTQPASSPEKGFRL